MLKLLSFGQNTFIGGESCVDVICVDESYAYGESFSFYDGDVHHLHYHYYLHFLDEEGFEWEVLLLDYY
jgi:hypothetical protein